jgi:hypothetical protein
MKNNIMFNPAVRSAEILRARFEVNSLLCLALGAVFLGTRARISPPGPASRSDSSKSWPPC